MLRRLDCITAVRFMKGSVDECTSHQERAMTDESRSGSWNRTCSTCKPTDEIKGDVKSQRDAFDLLERSSVIQD